MATAKIFVILNIVTVLQTGHCCYDASPFCRINGSNKLQQASENHTAFAPVNCADICYNKYGCRAFSYADGTRTCELHMLDMDRQAVVPNGSWSLYSRLACFKDAQPVYSCHEQRGCLEPIDLVVLFDASQLMGEENLNFTIELVTGMLTLFNFSNGLTRMGAITFGQDTHVVSKIGQYVTGDRIKKFLQEIPREVTSGNVNSNHIALMRNLTTDEGERRRAGATKIHVIFLAGDALSGSSISAFQTELDMSRADNIDFVFIALNPAGGTTGLMTYATQGEPCGYMKTMDNFNTLLYKVGEIAQLICDVATARMKHNDKLLGKYQ